jgi:hypothetical protein
MAKSVAPLAATSFAAGIEVSGSNVPMTICPLRSRSTSALPSSGFAP